MASSFAFNFAIDEDEEAKIERGGQNDVANYASESDPDDRAKRRGTADVDANDGEPNGKKSKLSAEDPRCRDRPRLYEKLAWADMMEECLLDAEIESVVCAGSKDGENRVELFSLHPSLVETRILALGEEGGLSGEDEDSIATAAKRRSDLVPHVYEGGLKIWECSLDLVRFLRENIEKLFPATGRENGKKKKRLRVLELGCGAGLPGIWALRHPSVEEVHFQDFNRQVVLGFTMPNVVVNDDEEGKSRRDACHFHFGDWSAMVEKFDGGGGDEKFDLILASETIYSLEDLDEFRDAVAHFLRPEGGVALVAAKEYYFGVGGGVDAFLDAVAKAEKPMKSETNWIQQRGVRRAIVELRF